MSAHAGEERLGPYRLHEQLGEGGMGVVYLACDPAGRPVAVKVLRQGVPAEATARRRLAREVDMMRRVHSPYVAEVVDADVEASPPYIVTRYVAGRTLEDTVAAEGPLRGDALASLAKGLAAALVAVHAAGIVHRDLKPGNVMLVGGQPVVIDFGIAQAPDSTRLTMTGMFMGTPGYLAPEIIEGRTSGPAADVHSFGATLAYAATGRPPFGTGQFEAIFYRIVHGQPDLAAMPAPLLPLVLSSLARDPARRPSAIDLAQSCAELDPSALVPGLAAGPAFPAGQAVRTAQDLHAGDLQGRDLRAPDLYAPDLPGNGAPALAAQAPPAALAGQPTVTAAGPAVPASAQAAGMQAAGMQAAGMQAAGMQAAAAPQAAWPGTTPMAAQHPDDFADLLAPVRYDQAGGPARAGTPGLAAGAPGPELGASWPGTGADLAVSPAGPGQDGTRSASSRTGPARRLLVAATLAALVAVSVLLPVAGAAVALALLILLRATDLTARWLTGKRSGRGPRRSDPVAAAAFYPWAIGRSVLRFVLLAPLALLCGAAAAVLAMLAAGPTSLQRAGAYAAGAVVACYCLGPGSAACRRPLSKFYGSITRTAPAAVLGTVGLVAVAAAVVAAAATIAPGYWPATHLGNQLQATTITHPGLNHLPANLADIGRKLVRWLGY